MVALGAKRSFLFLQGLATPFFARLAEAVEGRGHAAHRILLCGGDRVFWPKLKAVAYRGRFSDWRGFLGGFLHERGISDIVLFGDCRPYHRVALDLARSRGIKVHVFEEGYFRPEWVTLEREGTNGYSPLPRDAEAVLAEAAGCAEEELPQLVSGGFARRVRWEVLSQLATMALSPLYPHYRRHRSHHPLSEMAGWLKRLAQRPVERRYAERLVTYLQQGPAYYLLPLQLETDYQIRRHSPFKSMAHVMEVVLDSFAKSAPEDALMVVKLHPLDNGLTNFRKQAEKIARRLDIAGRVFVIDGGHLPTLLSKSEGVVVVNSTTGLSALNHNRAVKVLGEAIFDMAGLTFQGDLDRFWKERSAPDAGLFRAFRQVVLARAQINGSFFTEPGMALAIDGALQRMHVPHAASTATAPALAQPIHEAALAIARTPVPARRHPAFSAPDLESAAGARTDPREGRRYPDQAALPVVRTTRRSSRLAETA